MCLGLGLALNSKLPVQVAYCLASFPSVFILFEFFKFKRDQMGQILTMIQHNPKLARVKPEALMKKNTK